MSTSDDFLIPLSLFKERIAFSNAWATDFLVSHSSALFLDGSVGTVHTNVTTTIPPATRERAMIAGVLKTDRTFTTAAKSPPDAAKGLDNAICCRNLDSLAWTKYVVDLRRTLSVMKASKKEDGVLRDGAVELNDVATNPTFSSKQLARVLLQSTEPLRKPLGHSMIVANQKNEKYTKAFQAGKPIMDFLAELLLKKA